MPYDSPSDYTSIMTLWSCDYIILDNSACLNSHLNMSRANLINLITMSQCHTTCPPGHCTLGSYVSRDMLH